MIHIRSIHAQRDEDGAPGCTCVSSFICFPWWNSYNESFEARWRVLKRTMLSSLKKHLNVDHNGANSSTSALPSSLPATGGNPLRRDRQSITGHKSAWTPIPNPLGKSTRKATAVIKINNLFDAGAPPGYSCQKEWIHEAMNEGK